MAPQGQAHFQLVLLDSKLSRPQLPSFPFSGSSSPEQHLSVSPPLDNTTRPNSPPTYLPHNSCSSLSPRLLFFDLVFPEYLPSFHSLPNTRNGKGCLGFLPLADTPLGPNTVELSSSPPNSRTRFRTLEHDFDIPRFLFFLSLGHSLPLSVSLSLPHVLTHLHTWPRKLESSDIVSISPARSLSLSLSPGPSLS